MAAADHAVQDQALGDRTTHMYSKSCEVHSEKGVMLHHHSPCSSSQEGCLRDPKLFLCITVGLKICQPDELRKVSIQGWTCFSVNQCKVESIVGICMYWVPVWFFPEGPPLHHAVAAVDKKKIKGSEDLCNNNNISLLAHIDWWCTTVCQ